MSSNTNNAPTGCQMEGDKFISVFYCDICKVAKFDSVEKAEAHERNCKAASSSSASAAMTMNFGATVNVTNPPPAVSTHSAPPPRAPAAVRPVPPTAMGNAAASPAGSHATNHHAPNDGIINKTLFKCRKCKLLFWTTREAATHEQSCNDLAWYNCKVCQVLRFRSKEERAVHERTCSGPMPLRIADLPLADRVPHHGGAEGSSGNRGESARNVPAAAVSTSVAATGAGSTGAVHHQQVTTSNDNTQAQTNQGPTAAIETDKVRSIIDQYKNEVRRGSPQELERSLPAVNDVESDSSSVEIIEPSPKPAVHQQPPKPAALAQTTSSSSTNKDVKQSDSNVSTAPEQCYTTVWTCDICQEEQFEVFEEAVEHEKYCKGPKTKEKPQDPSSTGEAVQEMTPAKASALTAPAVKSSSPSKSRAKLLFSPMLKDSSDSTYYSQLSKFHRLVLKSIQLCYQRPQNNNTQPQLICLKCSHCSNFLPLNTETTIKKVAELLPPLVLGHTLDCEAMLNAEKVKISSAGTTGKIPLQDFLFVFFRENGIVENPSGIVVLSDDEFLKISGSERSKRFSQLNAGKKRRGRPATATTATKPGAKRRRSSKTGESPGDKSTPKPKHKDLQFGDMGCKMHNEEGTIFTLGPLDGLPFVTTFSREASKKILQPHRFMLQQMELFTISTELIESTKLNCSPDSVGIRCRHCIADKDGCCFMKLSSVKNLSRDVLVMAMEHLAGCKFMKAKDAKVIQDVKKGDIDYLNKYCNWIASLYCLEDSKPEKPPGVVFGDSPKVPGGYSTPADVDVSSVLGRPMPNLIKTEIPLPKVAEKAPSPEGPPVAKTVEEVERIKSVEAPFSALTPAAPMIGSSHNSQVLAATKDAGLMEENNTLEKVSLET